MEGTKKDEGKMRMDLLPPEALFAIAKVLTFGAEKYTKVFENKWEGFWDNLNATKIELFIQKIFVGHVMKNNLGEIILSTPNDNDKTLGPGTKTTQIALKSWMELEELILLEEQEIRKLSGLDILENMDSQKISTVCSSRKDVKSVGLGNTCTLITTTQQESSEVFCVANATTVLECLEITFKDLKKHLNISGSANLVEQTGERNWEKGMKWGRVFGALMRHLWAWWGGKGPTTKNFLMGDFDNETGFSHLWHAGCCLMFLIAYEEREIGEDDRAVKEEGPPLQHEWNQPPLFITTGEE